MCWLWAEPLRLDWVQRQGKAAILAARWRTQFFTIFDQIDFKFLLLFWMQDSDDDNYESTCQLNGEWKPKDSCERETKSINILLTEHINTTQNENTGIIISVSVWSQRWIVDFLSFQSWWSWQRKIQRPRTSTESVFAVLKSSTNWKEKVCVCLCV